jgi:hypothetical protein
MWDVVTTAANLLSETEEKRDNHHLLWQETQRNFELATPAFEC